MDTMEKILDSSIKQIEEIMSTGKYKSREDVHTVYELIDIIKDVWCIWKYEDGENDEYSENGWMNQSYPYRGGNGNSYARGRGARRDSMGRYSREGNSYRNGSYGRGRGYSRDDAKQDYIEQLRELMEDAPDEATRKKFQQMIRDMEEE